MFPISGKGEQSMAKTSSRSTKKKPPNKLGSDVNSMLGGFSNFWRGLNPDNSNLRQLVSLLLLVLIPLLAGQLAAKKLIRQPAVGIIVLDSDIYSRSAEIVIAQIEEARDDPSIKAVVLQMNSPGGTVTHTQMIYLELINLRQEMPVVSAIDSIAASGGFYSVMATNPIFALPSSTVGNVGVWGYIPPDLALNDIILASGPFKLTASNEAEFLREIEGIKQEFIQTVFNSRGDINISKEDLSQGFAYTGREAQLLGLIDHLGNLNDAIKEAADQAGITNYKVINLYDRWYTDYYYSGLWYGAADPMTGLRMLPPGVYLLFDVRLGVGGENE
jgi:protease-4